MSNAYTITGTVLGGGAATDPSLCRVSGALKDIMGQPLVGLGLVVRHIFSPVSLGTDTLIGKQSNYIRTDSAGLISFDAIRGATVRIEVVGAFDFFFEVEVPDQASVDLIDLILPYVVSVSFVDQSPLEVSVGERVVISTTVLLSNGETLSAGAAVSLSSSNEVVFLQVSTNVFDALAVGSVTVTVDQLDEDLLGLNQQADGSPIVRLEVPSTTLPSPLTVNVV